ncbi:MAG: sugar phosphate isomerase/epimerase [Phycisphaeraceae bacterium]|nr:sugar phosphate isomerase/epimerase [Phycisphaeraceae bacterium]MCB9847409.1 sugar phosphate isomerase/epimerase [Phycisphaeraceae bacterium]
MLLIFSAATYRASIKSSRRKLQLGDLPLLAHDEFGLSGLLVTTDLLAGWDTHDLDRLRVQADKSACPCLALVEPDPHDLGVLSNEKASESVDRMNRVLLAANRLGCSAVGFRVSGSNDSAATDRLVRRLKLVVAQAEKLDVNLLLAMAKGPTETAEGLIDTIKKVGGFRIGALADFQDAGATDDPADTIRRLAPYGPLVIASSVEFDDDGSHTRYDLGVCAGALAEVGYDGSIAIEYRGVKAIEQSIEWTKQTVERALTESES